MHGLENFIVTLSAFFKFGVLAEVLYVEGVGDRQSFLIFIDPAEEENVAANILSDLRREKHENARAEEFVGEDSFYIPSK
jgi:hypothetical protein